MSGNGNARMGKGAVVVGASSGMGAALARELARRGYLVALVGRRQDVLDQLSQDINRDINRARPDATGAPAAPLARAYAHDVRHYDEVPRLLARIWSDLEASGGAPRLVVYAAGVMPRGENGGWSFADERAMMEVNVIGAMAWLDAAAAAFHTAGRGTIAAISSVAGDRGRKGNSAYMASKAALSTYLESLRYRLHGTGVRVVTLKPGYVATAMTAGMKLPKPLVISADAAAKRIAVRCERGRDVAYIPGYWGPIMRVIRLVPAALMPRLPI
ncbi:MAG TPA: SDR family NAD(P)-dependent oxidoreductase [Ktedonobacterales bacterium]|jgi:short-subunit dehydrogenase|nr:SDR family NAD(P)-dependent oxidoreductase [Ktedonobacterales bacterium]